MTPWQMPMPPQPPSLVHMPYALWQRGEARRHLKHNVLAVEDDGRVLLNLKPPVFVCRSCRSAA